MANSTWTCYRTVARDTRRKHINIINHAYYEQFFTWIINFYLSVQSVLSWRRPWVKPVCQQILVLVQLNFSIVNCHLLVTDVVQTSSDPNDVTLVIWCASNHPFQNLGYTHVHIGNKLNPYYSFHIGWTSRLLKNFLLLQYSSSSIM